MRKALALLVFVVALLGCGVDRPEGVVERWLTAIAQGPTGEPEVYAAKDLSDDLVPPPREESSLEVIEVGKGRISGSSARVPFRIQKPDSSAELLVAELRRSEGTWRIVKVTGANSNLTVPTQGGERIGRASPLVWIGGLVVGLLVMLLMTVIMSLVRSPQRQ
jgi:hypothetical protein